MVKLYQPAPFDDAVVVAADRGGTGKKKPGEKPGF
jgi:hypothetical protein